MEPHATWHVTTSVFLVYTFNIDSVYTEYIPEKGNIQMNFDVYNIFWCT